MMNEPKDRSTTGLMAEFFLPIKTAHCPAARRFWCVLLAIALTGTNFGFPAAAVRVHAEAASLSGKDRSQPFPCMDRPCGCQSADECWHHCCCTTLDERLAWAHEHG